MEDKGSESADWGCSPWQEEPEDKGCSPTPDDECSTSKTSTAPLSSDEVQMVTDGIFHRDI